MAGILKCSIGVICYNEAANIAALLKALQQQKLHKVEIAEIIVVSSASSDGTDEIVNSFALQDARIRLIAQAQREGKASAINLFISASQADILVVESGDTIPAEDAIERLVSIFEDHKIGAAGGRPLPINSTDTLIGRCVHLLWSLHHRMALISPKLGELIVFRKVMDSIPSDSAVDEASIEAIIRSKRLRLKYVPRAIIENKGPENWKDFIKQRRRIYNGHLWLQDKQSYQVPSNQSGILLKVIMAELLSTPASLSSLVALISIELWCRVLGSIDYYIKKENPFKWDIAHSTKKLKT